MNLEEFIWYRLRWVCRRVLDRVAPDTVIPHDYHPDAVKVFDDMIQMCQIQKRVFLDLLFIYCGWKINLIHLLSF